MAFKRSGFDPLGPPNPTANDLLQFIFQYAIAGPTARLTASKVIN